MAKVSVIIPTTFGGFLHLTKLIPFLYMENGTEIIIIDNDSKDGTTNYLSNFECIIKINKIRKNFSESNNQGVKLAQGDYFLFLNNDTKISPNFVDEMLKTFEIDPKIGIVGCLIYSMDNPKKVLHAGICFTQNYVPYELGMKQPFVPEIQDLPANDPRVRSVREVPSVTAACMMVKREVFEKIGGFDEQYINGWEDTDFVLKARELGYKVFYTGKTFIHHVHFGSKHAGRFNFEAQNRKRYDDVWVTTRRAKKVLGKFREA